MAPTSLYHSHPGICKIIDTLFQNVRGWHEIGIQNKEKFAFRFLKSVVQGSRLEPHTILPPQHHRIESSRAKPGSFALRNLVGFIRRIVQNLYLQFLNRILNFTNRFQQSLDYMNFVVDRELNRYYGEVVKPSRDRWLAMPILEIEMNDQI